MYKVGESVKWSRIQLAKERRQRDIINNVKDILKVIIVLVLFIIIF